MALAIEFVNHSGFVVHSGDCHLMIDPWIDGRVFNNGWALISQSTFSIDDFARITHIWFSHEHPDHFHPPSLVRIPAEVRAKITVLFQQTRDKRVVEFCRKLGFKDVIEMAPGDWLDVGADLRALCEHYENGDSWLALRGQGQTLLNTNDCGMRDRGRVERLAERLGPIDVLTTQFSYAFWLGNEDEKLRRETYARQKLVDMAMQIDVFRPTYTIPIASFIRFCHEENRYLNDSINTAATVSEVISNETASEPIVLYPGDQWTVGTAHDNRAAIDRYTSDFEQAQAQRDDWERAKPVTAEQLELEGAAFVARLARTAGLLCHFLPTATIHIWDLGFSARLSPRDGLMRTEIAEARCDIALSADSLLLCLKEPWGQDTLGINGRFRKPAGGRYSRFYNLFRFGQLASRGVRVGPAYVVAALARKIAQRLGLGSRDMADA